MLLVFEIGEDGRCDLSACPENLRANAERTVAAIQKAFQTLSVGKFAADWEFLETVHDAASERLAAKMRLTNAFAKALGWYYSARGFAYSKLRNPYSLERHQPDVLSYECRDHPQYFKRRGHHKAAAILYHNYWPNVPMLCYSNVVTFKLPRSWWFPAKNRRDEAHAYLIVRLDLFEE